jgi:DNA end-binding protein Ku
MPATIWKGHITFGLISLPVRLSAAARSETISFNQLHKPDNSRVKQVLLIAEDKPVPRNDLIKGYDASATSSSTKRISNQPAQGHRSSRTLEARDLVQFTRILYLQPKKPEKGLHRPLGPQALGPRRRLTILAGNVVILRPGKKGLMLHHVLPGRNSTNEEFRTDGSIVKEPEVAMAQQLIDALVVPFEPAKYSDSYREALKAMITAKISGHDVVTAPPAQELAPVVNIMDALQQSLKALRKPPVSEKSTAQPQPKRRRA